MGDGQNSSVLKATDISGHVSPADVEFLEEVAGDNWTGDCAAFASKSGTKKQFIHSRSRNFDIWKLIKRMLLMLRIWKCFNDSADCVYESTDSLEYLN